MPLYLRDREIDEMIGLLAVKTKRSKTDIVRSALKKEIANENIAHSQKIHDVVKIGTEFARKLRSMGNPKIARAPMTKEEIDDLYE